MLRRTMLQMSDRDAFHRGCAVHAQAPAAPAGQAAPARGPASPPMVLSTPAFSDGARHPKPTHAGAAGRARHLAAARLDECARRDAELRRAHARSGSVAQSHDRRPGALARLEHTGHGKGPARGDAGRGRSCRTAFGKSARAATCIAVPAHPLPVRCITTPSRSTRSTPSSTSRPPPTHGRRGATCSRRWTATSSARR